MNLRAPLARRASKELIIIENSEKHKQKNHDGKELLTISGNKAVLRN